MQQFSSYQEELLGIVGGGLGLGLESMAVRRLYALASTWRRMLLRLGAGATIVFTEAPHHPQKKYNGASLLRGHLSAPGLV